MENIIKFQKLYDILKLIEDAHKSVKKHLTGRTTTDYINNHPLFYDLIFIMSQNSL